MVRGHRRGIVNLLSALLADVGERRREVAILRASGTRSDHAFPRLTVEGVLLALAGIACGLVSHWLVALAGSVWVEGNFGLAVLLY